MERFGKFAATLASMVGQGVSVIALWTACTFYLSAQQVSPIDDTSIVPTLINFSGTLTNLNGKPLSGVVGVTFCLYKDSQGGSPLWIETRNVQADRTGNYTVVLGATKSQGLPADMFASGEARWLGVQPQGQEEQPRVMLLAVPYALKALDAQTIGGLPPSAFVLAAPSSGTSVNSSSTPAATTSGLAPPSNPVTGIGTANFVPLWDSTSDIVSSVLFQSGTGIGSKIGINTTTPAATLDVNGAANFEGLLTLPAAGTATATTGFSSQAEDMVASVFNSNTSSAVSQTFQWKTEPSGNNTSAPSATLNLLFGPGATAPTETGLKLSNKGLFTFATGQKFPGTGTITGVTAGTDLTGGGTLGKVTLNLDTSKVPQLSASNTFTGNQTVVGNVSAAQLISTVATGTAPLQVTSTTQVPNLNVSLLGGFSASAFQAAGSYATLGANTFSGQQTVSSGDVSLTSGNLDLPQTTSVTAGIVNLGGTPFAHACCSATGHNTFVGGAGTFSNTGINNTAIGGQSLQSNTTGSQNTASGYLALVSNTSGTFNTAAGDAALYNNSTGFNNSALGAFAGNTTNAQSTMGANDTFVGYASTPGTQTNLTNATAIGANAEVDASNALILGSIKGINGASASVNVGIGTTTPASTLDVHGTGNFTDLVTFSSTQSFPGTLKSLTATAPLSASVDTSGNASLQLTGCGSAQVLEFTGSGWGCGNAVLGVTAGTDLTGGGSGGVVTLNLDTTKVPQLAAANTFVGNQSIVGNLSATGNITTQNGQLIVASGPTPGVFNNTAGGGNILVGQSKGAQEFTVDTGGNLVASGSVTANGALLQPTGTAVAGQGFNSNPLDAAASAYNGSTPPGAQNELFRWQVEPVGNGTASPSGSLNLLFASGSAAPSETGLSVGSNGVITFALGQTFPGAGGTITGVTAGSGLTGGGTTGTVNLAVDSTVARTNAANTFLGNQTVSGALTATSFSGDGSGLTNVTALTAVSANTAVTATNALSLGGLAPSSYQPAGSYATTGPNAFTGDQTITGDLTASGSVSANGETLTGGLTGTTATLSGTITAAGAALPATGAATAVQGFDSNPLDASASAFNSSSGAQNELFRWQVEPVGNNTSSPSGSLNLLFGAAGATPAETGLSVASNGVITFAPGQTFPGGGGTITGVTAGTDLTGGGTSGNVTLNLNTVATDLRYAQLGVSNLFTAPQTIAQSVSSPVFISTISSPNPPLVVSSNAQVANFNASFLDGLSASSFAGIGNNTFIANQTVFGNGESAVIGNMACGSNSAGIQLASGSVNCTSYALLDFNGQTVINRPTGQLMTFREGNGTVEMTIAPGGAVTMTTSPTSTSTGLTVTPPAGLAGMFQGGTDGFGRGHDGIDVFGGAGAAAGAGDGLFVKGGSGPEGSGIGLDVFGGNATGNNFVGGDAIVATPGLGAGTAGPGLAADLSGNVEVDGNLSKTSGSFKIDHPSDPANKYLYHSFVESPDMKNIYDGLVTLDANGEAAVDLPEWFGTLNRDFRYQLTAVGAPGPNLYIAQEIENNSFRIAGGQPGSKVSWQVTGIRQDAWANAHRIPVEQEKPDRERGFYIHPELFGVSQEKGIEWARHPEMMKRIKEQREKAQERASSPN
jgi:hypothetical protein